MNGQINKVTAKAKELYARLLQKRKGLISKPNVKGIQVYY